MIPVEKTSHTMSCPFHSGLLASSSCHVSSGTCETDSTTDDSRHEGCGVTALASSQGCLGFINAPGRGGEPFFSPIDPMGY